MVTISRNESLIIAHQYRIAGNISGNQIRGWALNRHCKNIILQFDKR